MTGRPPSVSVVIPVFDAGSSIEPAIRSILAQTLPPGAVEAIFVDDGSTDGTGALLDGLAAEHPATMRVIHIAPSGAPGRPRNVGIEAARGDYIQFLDADDELAPDALERLVAIAEQHRSDVVVGKFASATMRRSQRLFDRSVARTTLSEMPALIDSSLGPTKLYRRSFLSSQGIRFPEGWRQMEDQAFTIRAYARAGSIAISADRPSYFFHRRDDGDHLTSERIEPERHFRNLRAVLDIIEAEIAPGSLRDRAIRRMLRVEALSRVSEPGYLELPDDDRDRLFAEARDFVRERIHPVVIGALGPIHRCRCELLRDDRPDDLLRLARQLQDLVMTATIGELAWDGGALRIATTATLTFRSTGRPLLFALAGERSQPGAASGRDRGDLSELTLERAPLFVQLVIRSRRSALEWYVNATAHQLGDRVGASVRALIDPLRLGPGHLPIDAGSWDVHVRLTGLGIEWSAPLGAAPFAVPAADVGTVRTVSHAGTCRPALLGDPPRVVVPVADPAGVRLDVDPPAAVTVASLETGQMRLIRDGDRLLLDLPMIAGPRAGRMAAALVVIVPDGERVLPATLRPRRGRVVFDARMVGPDRLPAGHHPIRLRLGGAGDTADLPLGAASVDDRGAILVAGLERRSVAGRAAADVAWAAARAIMPLERFRSWADSVTHRAQRRVMRSVRSRAH